MSKIVTVAHINVRQDTVFHQILPEPGEGRGYEIQALSASIRTSGQGLMVALQDGEIEEALIETTDVGAWQAMTSATSLVNDELHVYGSVGVDPNTAAEHASKSHVFPPGFVVVNAQYVIVMNGEAANSKNTLIHVQYENVKMSNRAWVELRHRSPVVHLVTGAIT